MPRPEPEKEVGSDEGSEEYRGDFSIIPDDDLIAYLEQVGRGEGSREIRVGGEKKNFSLPIEDLMLHAKLKRPDLYREKILPIVEKRGTERRLNLKDAFQTLRSLSEEFSYGMRPELLTKERADELLEEFTKLADRAESDFDPGLGKVLSKLRDDLNMINGDYLDNGTMQDGSRMQQVASRFCDRLTLLSDALVAGRPELAEEEGEEK